MDSMQQARPASVGAAKGKKKDSGDRPAAGRATLTDKTKRNRAVSTRAAGPQAAHTGAAPPAIQRKALGASNGVAPGAEPAIALAASSGGAPLPGAVRRKFESSLGSDLGDVRVHTGADSAAAAESVSAKAYTVGSDIHFGAGHYDPSSQGGQRLLAHEVAHTVQQAGGTSRKAQFKLDVSAPGDAHELEADAAADSMVEAKPATIAAAGGLARKVNRDVDPTAGGPVAASPGQITLGWETESLPILKQPPAGENYVDLSAGLKAGIKAVCRPPSQGGAAAPNVGAAVAPDEQGIETEVEKELDAGILGITPTLKSQMKITNKQLTAGYSIDVKTKWGPVHWDSCPLKFDLVRWEKGKAPQFGVATAQLTGNVPFVNFTTSKGIEVTLDCSGTVAIHAAPDAVKCGEYVLENMAKWYGEDAAVGALLDGSIVTVGLLTIGCAVYEIACSDDLTNMTEPKVQELRGFCSGFASACMGEPCPGGPGAANGYSYGQAKVATAAQSIGAPEVSPVIAAIQSKHKDYDSFYMASWKASWPTVKQKILDEYYKKHYIEKFLTGGTGSVSGGMELKMLLEGWDNG